MTILQTTLADQLKLQGVEEEAAEDVAMVLQPLLEQEAQLEYVFIPTFFLSDSALSRAFYRSVESRWD